MYEEYNSFDINDGEFTSEDIKRFHLEGFAKNGQLEVSDDVAEAILIGGAYIKEYSE